MTFHDLGLSPEILTALDDLGYTAPTPIQAGAIPPALTGRDVLGCAQTGTGKTCAFATPILQRLSAHPVKGHPIRALILTPTRELALQIQESFIAYGKNLPLRSAVIFGGVGQQKQVDQLKHGVDILVATPGRLQDLRDQGFIHVEKLEIFVLDEADRMLDMGFIHDVKKVLSWLPKKKQTLFFSATMPPEVQGLVDSLLTDPAKIEVDPVSSPAEVIDQRLYYVDRANKSKLLASLIREPGVKNALVFTRTKHGANKVCTDLVKAGIPAAAIHGNKSQTARQQALSDFKAGRIKALVATDIAARGIDIEELSHVFNYNLPDVPETYVHRIGRTGRAGHGGTAVTFCEFGEKDLLKPIEKLMKRAIAVVEGHPWPMEVFEAPKRDRNGKIINADDAEARQAARERKKARQAAQPKPVQELEPVSRPTQKRRGGKAQSTAPVTSKQAPGYRPSRTLEEALNAMAPTYTEAEKQAMEAQTYRDPLAGEVIMDASARFLSPRKSSHTDTRRPANREQHSGQDRRKKKGSSQDQPAQKGQSKGRGQKGQPGQSQKGKGQQNKPQQGKAPQNKSNPRRGKRNDRRGPRRPMEVTLRLGNQKDSTEQSGSLMKPYYFGPYED